MNNLTKITEVAKKEAVRQEIEHNPGVRHYAITLEWLESQLSIAYKAGAKDAIEATKVERETMSAGHYAQGLNQAVAEQEKKAQEFLVSLESDGIRK